MTKTPSLPHVGLALLVAVLWGINFVFAKAAVLHFSPFTMLSIRFLMVICLLLPFYPKPPIALIKIFQIAIAFAVLHIGCMFWSLHLGLDASVGIVVEQLGIPFVLILGVFIFKEKVGMRGAIGVLLAILGTFFLMEAPNSIANPLAFVLMIGSAFFWACYSILIKTIGDVNPLALVAWVSLAAFSMMVPLALIFEDNHFAYIASADSFVWFSIVYMALAASIVAHGLWYYLLSNNPVQTVAPITLLVPLFGVAGGVAILGEALTMQMVIGALLMTAGVGIVLLRKPQAVPADIDA